MVRALIGAVAGAVAMFIIGFIFFGIGLERMVIGSLDNAQAAAVQQAMAANIPSTGAYVIPNMTTPEQTIMYGHGPTAIIQYDTKGYPAADPAVMIEGFIEMLVVTLIMAFGLRRMVQYIPDFGEQIRLLGAAILGIAIFMRIGDAIWMHYSWSFSIYGFINDAISLSVAGAIILKLLPKGSVAAAPAGATSDL